MIWIIYFMTAMSILVMVGSIIDIAKGEPIAIQTSTSAALTLMSAGWLALMVWVLARGWA